MVSNLAELDAKRAELTAEIGRKRYFRATERTGIELEIAAQEAELLKCYNPAIDEAIKFLQDYRETLLKKSIVEQERHGKRNIGTDMKEIAIFSNCDSIKSALAYCLAGIKELESMKLLAVPDTDRIEALRDNIPNADELREYTKIKNLDVDEGPGMIAVAKRATENYISHLLGKNRARRLA